MSDSVAVHVRSAYSIHAKVNTHIIGTTCTDFNDVLNCCTLNRKKQLQSPVPPPNGMD